MRRRTREGGRKAQKMSALPKTLKKEIRLQTVKDLIIQHLYACSIIDDNIEIKDIEFSPWFADPIELTIKTKGTNGGISIKLNG